MVEEAAAAPDVEKSLPVQPVTLQELAHRIFRELNSLRRQMREEVGSQQGR